MEPPPDDDIAPGNAMDIEPTAEPAGPDGQRVPWTPEDFGQRVPVTPEVPPHWVDQADHGAAAIDLRGDTGPASS
eukprot:7428759-Heterocapsa_arctica.AAC.1